MQKTYMRMALELAAKGRGNTSPNPMVGAVLVKNGSVIANGYHKIAGGPHAEIEVLRKAGKRAFGTTLYVNLEPCCHFGKTPPCTSAIVKAGVRKVVYSILDPNPRVHGKGAETLKKAGIEVLPGMLKEDARKLNEAYLKWMGTKLPFVTLFSHQTLDAKGLSKESKTRAIPRSTTAKLGDILYADLLVSTTVKPAAKPQSWLRRLAEGNILSVMVPATNPMTASLLENGLVDKYCALIRLEMGGRGNTYSAEPDFGGIANIVTLRDLQFQRMENYLLTWGYLN